MYRRNTLQATASVSEPLWDKRITARFLGVSIKTLNRWMADGTGPQARKIGVQVRYLPSDVHAFVENCAVRP
jgi:predicted DNA-binding transcriptional regulator AlpA